MATGAVQPGSLDLRYEEVSGGWENRRTYYYVRKILHFSADEWDALTWWQRRMYIEQMTSDPEFNEDAEDGPSGDNVPSEHVTSFDDLPD